MPRGADREELFGALLRRISEPGTLDVVVVEDVHWADEATTDLLRFLGRRLRGVPALLIVSYRDEGLSASHPLRVMLGDLSALRQARRVLLEPLSAASVRRLAAPSGLDPDELYRLTGGNPFFVTEVLEAGIRQVPAAARDAVLARAARLSAAARELLDVAALLGTRVEPGLIAAAAPGSAALVDEILASGLLTEDGTRLSFRHEIARLAIEQAIPAHRRGPLHGRILAALLALGRADDARLAYHAEGAADGPGGAALRPGRRPARRRAGLAPGGRGAVPARAALRAAPGTGGRRRALRRAGDRMLAHRPVGGSRASLFPGARTVAPGG